MVSYCDIKFLKAKYSILITSVCTQGVLKVRKRVTLMVVTVSAIFVICWGTDEALHVVEQATSYKFAPVVFSITHTMIMFNSAVNPFAYALINQRFREKIKGMICCPTRVYVAREPQGIEMTNGIVQLPTCRPTQQDWVPHGLSRWRQIKCQHGFVNPFDTDSSQVISHNSNNSSDVESILHFPHQKRKSTFLPIILPLPNKFLKRYLGVMEVHQDCLLFQ